MSHRITRSRPASRALSIDRIGHFDHGTSSLLLCSSTGILYDELDAGSRNEYMVRVSGVNLGSRDCPVYAEKCAVEYMVIRMHLT